MTNIHFYHLTTTPLERALPKLLEKAYTSGFRVLVVAEDMRIDRLNEALWTYDPNSFLPHGSAKDGHAEQQPIYLDTTLHAASGYDLLCITNGILTEPNETYRRVIDIFDGGNEESVSQARTRWQCYKEMGNPLVYYQQTETGGWQENK